MRLSLRPPSLREFERVFLFGYAVASSDAWTFQPLDADGKNIAKGELAEALTAPALLERTACVSYVVAYGLSCALLCVLYT